MAAHGHAPAAAHAAAPGGMLTKAWDILHFVGFLLPYIIIIGSYAIFPVLRYRVGDQIPADENLYQALLFTALAYVGWWIWDFLIIINARTSGAQLKFAVFVGMLNTLSLTFFAGSRWGADELGWWIIVALIAFVIDDLVSAYAAINNAIQKPVVERTT